MLNIENKFYISFKYFWYLCAIVSDNPFVINFQEILPLDW